MNRFGGPYDAAKLARAYGLGDVALAVRERCVADPLYLASEVMSDVWRVNLMDRPSEAHRLVSAAMVAQKNILYVDARGTAKTTLLDEVGGVHQLLSYCDDALLFLLSSAPNGRKISGLIRAHFTRNARLRALFPEYAMQTGDDGNIIAWNIPCRQRLSAQSSVEIATPGSATAGNKYDVIFASDIMNENTTPPPCGLSTIETMRSLIAWYSQVEGLLQRPAVNPRAAKRIDSNRWHDGDLAGTIMRRDAGDAFVKVVRGVKQLADGRWLPSWPEVQTSEEIQTIFESPTMNLATFAANFQSDPKPDGGMTFLRPWFKEYRDVPEGGETAITCDPAFTRAEKKGARRSDRSALVVSKVAPDGRLYLLTFKTGRWTASEFCDRLTDLCVSWNPAWVGIEDTGGSRAIIEMFAQRLQRENLFIPYREIAPGTQSKEVRMVPLHSFAQRYGIHVRPGEHDEMVEDLLRFGVAEHEDLAEAFGFRAWDMWYRTGVKKPVADRPASAPPTPKTTGTDLLKAFNRMEVDRRRAQMRRIA